MNHSKNFSKQSHLEIADLPITLRIINIDIDLHFIAWIKNISTIRILHRELLRLAEAQLMSRHLHDAILNDTELGLSHLDLHLVSQKYLF